MKCMNIACDQHNKTYLYGCEKLLYNLKRLKDCVQYRPEKSSFDAFVDQQCERIKSILKAKAGEYSSKEDRLKNFRTAAEVNNTTMPKALWGMASKHLVSVMDLVDGSLEPTEELVLEKCTDLVNYIIILSYMLLDDDS